MKYLRTFEKDKYEFKIGEYVIWPPFKYRRVKVVGISECCLIIEDEYGYRGEFLKKDFIPETDYYAQKYNL